MKIFLIIEEDSFYQPNFAADLIRNKNYEIVGGAVVTKVSAKNSLVRYLINNWYYLTFKELLLLAIKKVKYIVKDITFRGHNNGPFFSVSSVFKYFQIDHIKVEYNINQDHYLNFIEDKAPDVIISSNPLILKKKLLSIPKICCINRHSSLLPAYAGLWPVLHAIRSGEEFVGVTIHTMELKIDQGVILAQEKIRIEPKDTVDSLYKKCFDISAELCFNALEKVKGGKIEQSTEEYNNLPPSYFGFPTKEHWIEFRNKKGKFI